MKTPRTFRLLPWFSTLMLALGVAPSMAQTDGTWTNTVGNDTNVNRWFNTANWLNGAVPDSAGSSATLTNGNKTVYLDGNVTVGGITNGNTSWTIRSLANSTNIFTLDTGSAAQPVINVASNGLLIFVQSGTYGMNMAGTNGYIKEGAGTLYTDIVQWTNMTGNVWIKEGMLQTYSHFVPGHGSSPVTITLGGGASPATLAGSPFKTQFNLNTNVSLVLLEGQQRIWQTGNPDGTFGSISGVVSGTGSLLWQPIALTNDPSRSIWANFGNANSTYSGGTTISNNGINNMQMVLTASSLTNGSGEIISGPLGTGTLTLAAGGLRAKDANRTLHNDIVLAGDVIFGDSSRATNHVDLGRNLTLAGDMTLTGNRVVSIETRQPDLSNLSNNFVRINGTIGDGGNGYGLTVRSIGTNSANDVLVLGGSNSYTGATVVESGVLRLAHSNAVSASTNVRVNGRLDVAGLGGGWVVGTSQTLSGSGVVTGDVTVSGLHSPGNSPGIQTFSNNLTYAGTSPSVLWELTANTTAQGSPTAVYDQIIVGGNLDFSVPTALDLSFDFAGSAVDWSDALWDSDITGTAGWLIYDVAGTSSNLTNLTITGANWLDGQGDLFNTVRAGSTFSLYQDGEDIYLNYVVPEPSTYALLALAAAGLGAHVVRRRRR